MLYVSIGLIWSLYFSVWVYSFFWLMLNMIKTMVGVFGCMSLYALHIGRIDLAILFFFISIFVFLGELKLKYNHSRFLLSVRSAKIPSSNLDLDSEMSNSNSDFRT